MKKQIFRLEKISRPIKAKSQTDDSTTYFNESIVMKHHLTSLNESSEINSE